MCSIDFPAWIQAITALAALIIAFVTLNSQKKIKTLTEVVLELQEQTKLISKRYDLEKKLSLRYRLPDFEVTNFVYVSGDESWRIELTNRGQFATSFFTNNMSSNINSIRIGDYRNIGESNILQLFIHQNPVIKEMREINFQFTLVYKNGNGILLSQNIVCDYGQILIVPQTDGN